MDKKEKFFKIMVVISFIALITVNVLSFIVPFSGRSITEVAASYPNLFAPAFYVYSIWIPVFVLMGLFAVYQLNFFGHNHVQIKKEALYHARMVYIMVCILLSVGIFAWIYDYIALSAMLILTLAICLQFFCRSLSTADLSKQEKLFIRLPFSLLYGWLTISTATTVIVLFASVNFTGLGLPIWAWSMATLAVFSIFAAYRTQRNRDIVYSFPILWDYIGILVRHLSKNGFDGQYPQIIITAILGIALLTGNLIFVLWFKKKKTRLIVY
jgi:uncharacterized membrane protein YwzB